LLGLDFRGGLHLDFEVPDHDRFPCLSLAYRALAGGGALPTVLNAANEALVAAEERYTFADLDRLSERVAHGLVARGMRKGDRVGIAMRNCPSWILTYMGVVKAGGIATLLNGWWEPAEMEHAIALTDPKLIIADTPRVLQ